MVCSKKKGSLSSGKISHCQSHHEVFVERLRELNSNMFRYVKKCYVAEKFMDLVRFYSAKIEQKNQSSFKILSTKIIGMEFVLHMKSETDRYI